MKYVMTLKHCPNPDISSLRVDGYYSELIDKKPIKVIGSSYKEMRQKFFDWRDRNDLGGGNVPWIVVSFIGKDKLIKPVARFSANGRLWELDDNDDSFNSSDPREICIDIDDDKETMDKYATGEIKPVEPEPVKPPTNFDHIESLNFIWDKLHRYRNMPNDIEEDDSVGQSMLETEWEDICISMAWIEGGCDVERVEGILEPKNNNKTKKVTKSSKILSGRDKVIIEMQIEYDVPQGLSYAEKVQFTEDLELPTGYVEDSFGIVEFSNKKESN